MVQSYLPYYVSSVRLSNWLHDMTQIPSIFQKEFIDIPEVPLKNKAIPFKVFDPYRYLTGFIDTNNYQGVNIFVYCSLIKFHIIASIAFPLLKLMSLNRNSVQDLTTFH